MAGAHRRQQSHPRGGLGLAERPVAASWTPPGGPPPAPPTGAGPSTPRPPPSAPPLPRKRTRPRDEDPPPDRAPTRPRAAPSPPEGDSDDDAPHPLDVPRGVGGYRLSPDALTELHQVVVPPLQPGLALGPLVPPSTARLLYSTLLREWPLGLPGGIPAGREWAVLGLFARHHDLECQTPLRGAHHAAELLRRLDAFVRALALALSPGPPPSCTGRPRPPLTGGRPAQPNEAPGYRALPLPLDA